VSPQVGNVYFDTCTLSNFAVVGRLWNGCRRFAAVAGRCYASS
jgi:hypothetical protein